MTATRFCFYWSGSVLSFCAHYYHSLGDLWVPPPSMKRGKRTKFLVLIGLFLCPANQTLKEFVGVAEAEVGSVKDLYSVAVISFVFYYLFVISCCKVVILYANIIFNCHNLHRAEMQMHLHYISVRILPAVHLNKVAYLQYTFNPLHNTARKIIEWKLSPWSFQLYFVAFSVLVIFN